jgi:hypothetical protein
MADEGVAYALIGHPFAQVRAALTDAGNWCDILTLHLNVKGCRASDARIALYLGKKTPQSLEDASRLAFTFSASASGQDYLQVQLAAQEGPMGTSDYRITLEAAPMDEQRTLLRFSYAYSFGVRGRLAMSGYLSTIGASKIGFTVTGTSNGQPVYVKGVRGVVERNTMRYYLAIQTWMDALDLPADQRLEKRLAAWFEATERYAPQLHELERAEYLDMKRAEFARQRSQPG